MTTKTRDDDSPNMDKVRRFLMEASHYIKRANLEMVGREHPIRDDIFDADDAVFAALESLKEEANG